MSFRYYTKAKADELGLAGIVRNEKDGTVYIEAEGEEEKIEEFIVYCRKGSRWAKVKKLDFKYLDSLNDYKEFSVTY